MYHLDATVPVVTPPTTGDTEILDGVPTAGDVEAADLPGVPGDADGDGVEGCACCGGAEPGCRRATTLGCDTPTWPAAVKFTLSGLGDGDAYPCCCHFTPQGPGDCLNREWGVPGDPPGTAGTNPFCGQNYSFFCEVNSLPTKYVSVRILVSFVPDTSANTMTVSLSVVGVYDTQLYVSGGCGCVAERTYRAVYDFDAFPCDGPWSLADTGGSDLGGLNQVSGWPGSISLHGSDTVTGGCCDPPDVHDCEVDPTWDCDPETQTCSDPGTGLGEHSSYDDCLAACVTTPLGDSGDDSGGGRGVEDLACCVGHTLPRTLSVAVVNIANFPCLEGTYNITWANALKAWTGSFVACSTFVSLYFYCLGGQYGFKLVCNGAPIVSQLHEPGLPCDPISEVFSGPITIPSSCGALPGEVNIFVSGGS